MTWYQVELSDTTRTWVAVEAASENEAREWIEAQIKAGEFDPDGEEEWERDDHLAIEDVVKLPERSEAK
jgi:predicted transcriptional regulator